ncbi:MAG: hypothetical protein HKP58_02965 [Desulfatitalea sp.]|nr:hypothetical protein [Desulfatitalea sp.]NNJ99352.1 hypothetical protein [Desulfatitalea sp.]
MNRSLTLWGVLACVAVIGMACAKPVNIRGDQPAALTEVETRADAFNKKAAIGLKSQMNTIIGHKAEALMMQTVITAIRSKAPDIDLLTPEDEPFPAFMQAPDPFSTPDDVFAVTQQSRMQGFHFLLQTTIVNIRPEARRTGVWWFRKDRKFLTLVVAVDAYDTFSSAKVFSQVEEKTIRIDDADYTALLSQNQRVIAEAQEAIADMAEDLGRGAAAAMSKAVWMAAVSGTDGTRIQLAVDRGAGLNVGSRLTVFEFQRVLEGFGRQRFLVPGYKVADIQITAVGDRTAEAVATGQADIRVGDIAVVVK